MAVNLRNFCTCWKNNGSGKSDNVQNEEIKQGKKAYLLQFINILSAYILLIDGGAHATWSSSSLPYLMGKNSDIPISADQGSWLVSLISLSAIFGPMFYLMTMNQLGRKYTILIIGIIQLISWILINLSHNYTLLCVSMSTFGLAYGVNCCIIPIYIGEIARKNIRGIYLSLIMICINIGNFLMNTAGAFLPYKTTNLVMTSIPILALVPFAFMSETPYFYLMKGREEEAIKILMKLSAVKKRDMVMDDIERIKKTIAENEESNKNIFRELFFDKGSRKAFIILIITSSISSLSGFTAIQAHAQEILSYSGSKLAPKYGVVILSGIQIFSGLLSTVLIDFWGRKPAYLLSGILSALSLTTIGFFYLLQYFFKFDTSSFTWTPLVGLIFFIFTCNIGISTIPFVYSGELFSVHMKLIAIMCGGISYSLGAFVANFLLQVFNASGGIYIAFWVFSFFCILGPLTVWITMPETMGKNLEEVLTLMNV